MAPYLAVAADLRAQILSGELSGEMPPVREQARAYGVSPNTVSKALRLLREEGLTDSRQGWRWRVLGPQERG